VAARPKRIQDVVATQLCCGCGACAYISPGQIHMVDSLRLGRRPIVKDECPAVPPADDPMRVCPGVRLERSATLPTTGILHELMAGWGPVLELWEGHARDREIRFAGSSGGTASALALFCIERAIATGVLHVAARPDVPYLNHTVLSRSRQEILERTGSRYSPASPCDGLQRIEDAPGPCVFIGKPCDVAAVRMACKNRPSLERNLCLTIAIFCAGTPSTAGTLELSRKVGITDPSRILGIRYRGNGWPGKCTITARTDGGSVGTYQVTYQESWGEILQKHRQWRCYICPDHSGEFADIALADPWYKSICEDDPGQSLILVRTEQGRRILHGATEAGYLELEPSEPRRLRASQPQFEASRGSLWARLLALRLFGVPTPRYRGFPMFRFWCSRLGWQKKMTSFLGTIRRIFVKRLRTRVVVDVHQPLVPQPDESR